MANRKRNNLLYSKIAFVLLIAALATGTAFAHGHEKHVMGTIKAVGTDSVTVETTSHQSQTVQITSETKFMKNGAGSSLSELKAGDRVVIHAKASGDKLEATEVKFGAAQKASAAKKR
jgi:Cu/Ag efflux protein CusF